jgi:tetratricopeptide (TPR) repeat protein
VTVNIEETIARAKELRRADELEESLELLLDLLGEHPDDPLVLHEVGGAYDLLGEVDDAIVYYQKALDAGLAGDPLQECLLCLGICQRGVGEFDAAVATLATAVDQFPERNSSRVFLALAYYSNDQPDEAVRLLLDLLLKTTQDPDIQSYADTLDYYKDNLDEVWDEE